MAATQHHPTDLGVNREWQEMRKISWLWSNRIIKIKTLQGQQQGQKNDKEITPMKSILVFAMTFFLFVSNTLADSTDFNLDGLTSLGGDGAIVFQNLGSSGSIGDANGDGSVNLAGDMSAVISGLATDVVPAHSAIMKYYWQTGEVKFSSTDPGDGSGPLQLVISTDNGSLTGANASNTTPAFKLQPGTTKDISGLPNQLAYFNGDGFTLDDKTAGLLLPSWATFDQASSYANNHLFFTFQNAGFDPVGGGILLVPSPEPSSLVLAVLAGVGLFWFRRRSLISRSS